MHEFVLQFADTTKPSDVRSSHALDMLADIYAEDEGKGQDAAKVRNKDERGK
jgi:protein farnesyltransferase/geranylgeranyltransferase type-1 subunit alpha